MRQFLGLSCNTGHDQVLLAQGRIRQPSAPQNHEGGTVDFSIDVRSPHYASLYQKSPDLPDFG
jgi:hypothetical protein